MMFGDAGFDAIALASEETCEHDRSTKRYDKLGQQCDKFLRMLKK